MVWKENKISILGLNVIACFFAVYFLLCILFISARVEANDQYPSWAISGFGTIGLARTNTDLIGFYRERSQEKAVMDSWEYQTDTRLGIQLDVEISDSFHSTIQWVGREHSGDFLEQNLDWAFLRWSPCSDTDVRIGRMGFDSFLLSEYRNVGYAYPWVRPPHEFYANVAVSHFDGIDARKTVSLAGGYLSLKAYAGYSSLFQDYAGVELDGPLAGANIVYEFKNWRIKAGYTFIELAKEQMFLEEDLSYLEMDEEILPGLTNTFQPLLSTKGSQFHFMTIGTEYDDGIWLIQAEASYMNTESIFYHDLASGYLSIGRRFSEVTVYSLFGISKGAHSDVKIPKITSDYIDDSYAEEIYEYWQSIGNGKGTGEKSVSFGFRWDFHPKAAFKAEWNHFWISDTGLLWEQFDDGRETPQTVDVMSFCIDFIF